MERPGTHRLAGRPRPCLAIGLARYRSSVVIAADAERLGCQFDHTGITLDSVLGGSLGHHQSHDSTSSPPPIPAPMAGARSSTPTPQLVPAPRPGVESDEF